MVLFVTLTARIILTLLQTSVRSWRSLYLDLTASLLIYLTAVFLIVFREFDPNWRIDGSIAGIAITNALVVVIFGQWTIRAWMDVRVAMLSVQQLAYYGDHIAAEVGSIEYRFHLIFFFFPNQILCIVWI